MTNVKNIFSHYIGHSSHSLRFRIGCTLADYLDVLKA